MRLLLFFCASLESHSKNFLAFLFSRWRLQPPRKPSQLGRALAREASGASSASSGAAPEFEVIP